ncbi:MAG: oxygen-independent coproporphyrinogen III oxidase [Gammaproteobacteria bacterium]|nr:oxygen-independent coproporphyrinogen III oxidase [Gammaproteobacteria bacterium]
MAQTDSNNKQCELFEINNELISRYDKSGPRYTSYPTAASFHEGITEKDFFRHAELSNELPVPKALSLYVHVPFCDTICFYCGCNKIATKDNSRANEYLDYLEKEAAILENHFDEDRLVTQLHWGGGTPTFLNTQQIERLMKILSTHWTLDTSDERDFSIEIDPRSTSVEGIKHLASLGFNRFSLGVQDINLKVQQAINRIQPLELNKQIIDACREVGSKSINIDLIYGLPLQTVDTFSETLDAIIELSPDRLSVFNYAHLPTLFKPQRRINEDELPSANQKLEMFSMIANKLTNAGYIYIGMDHFAKPEDELSKALNNGTLQRNFQGYTTHADCDLVSLGVSAISSFDGLMSQNAKTVEEYYEKLDAGQLAVIKGVELTEEDRMRREVIQQIMCQNKLDLSKITQMFDLSGWSDFTSEFEELKPMEEDGLVEITSSGVQITPKGRVLARNIAMVFDTATKKLEIKTRFSKVI